MLENFDGQIQTTIMEYNWNPVQEMIITVKKPREHESSPSNVNSVTVQDINGVR